MNIPNGLSIFRILLIPVFVLLFFSDGIDGNLYYATAVFCLAGITDIVDGKIARKYNQITTLGKILDPLADKLMVFSALLCCMLRGLLPQWAVILFFVKELGQGTMGLVFYFRVKDVPPSNMIGKAGTVLFYIIIAASILFDVSRGMVYAMLGITFAVIFTAWITYTLRGLNMSRSLKAAEAEEAEKAQDQDGIA